MNKNIKDYLHLYFSGKVMHPGLRNPLVLTGRLLQSYTDKGIAVKPVLRSLSDITDEELTQLNELGKDSWERAYLNEDANFTSRQFLYLLKESFDLFGLIEAGLAVIKKK